MRRGRGRGRKRGKGKGEGGWMCKILSPYLAWTIYDLYIFP